MGLLLKLFPGQWFIYVGVLAASFILGGTAAWTVQGWRLDKVKAEYKSFVTDTKTQGEAAEKAAKKQADQDKLNKQKADDENKRTLAALTSTIKRLRSNSAAGGGLSAPRPPATSPDRTCFDPTKLDAALRRLDEGVLGIVETGSEAVIKLDTVKIWAAK